MDSVLQSDIFFFISSLSVIFITIGILIILMYIISILRDVRAFFNSIRKGTDALSEDLSNIRTKLNDKGVWTGLMLSLITAVAGFSQKFNSSRKAKNKD